MMPFALDLMSTFVMGSTFPVATTETAMVPRSTVAIRAGSIAADPPPNADSAQKAIPTRMTPARIHFLRGRFIDTSFDEPPTARVRSAAEIESSRHQSDRDHDPPQNLSRKAPR